MNFYCTALLYNTLTMEKNTHKQNALSLKVKMEILQAINKDGQTKAEICIKFSIIDNNKKQGYTHKKL